LETCTDTPKITGFRKIKSDDDFEKKSMTNDYSSASECKDLKNKRISSANYETVSSCSSTNIKSWSRKNSTLLDMILLNDPKELIKANESMFYREPPREPFKDEKYFFFYQKDN
jgi:hypothetical protein